MHTHLTRSSSRRTPLVLAAASLLCAGNVAFATGAPSNAPQVLIAITNSESMDGTTAGAIMTGSGMLGSNYSSLSTSSSPTNYTVPAGFTSPITGAAAGASAPYTAYCSGTSGNQCDNGPSRMNFTKAAISQILTNYGTTMNFGIYTYSTGSPTVYGTYVYYMSPTNPPNPATANFSFQSTATSTGNIVVGNPCYGTQSSAVASSCSNIASSGLFSASTLSTNQYMVIGATSDNPQINDVLYTGSGGSADFITYGTVTPANPYTAYTLSTYVNNNGSFAESYNKNTDGGGFTTTPTNAGYVPFAPQVMYSARGWGYGASQSATTGNAAVPMNTDPASSTFTNALASETNKASTSEIKSVAGQSALYALMNGAKSYLNGLTTVNCQGQSVVLMTDGLPTLDSAGGTWPPLGTTTANQYALTATFNSDGSFQSSNSKAVTDAFTAITALYNASGTTHIKVYVIGLGAGVDPTVNSIAAQLLQAMAIAGGTSNYQAANSAAALTAAFGTIVNEIYNDSAIAAPVAPISVANGSGHEYDLTSIAVPAAGHVTSYPVQANGTASTTPDWDAAALMTVAARTTGPTALIAPSAAGTTMSTLTTFLTAEPTVYALSPTTCVPDVNTIVQIVINPSYTGGACSGTGANAGTGYLAGRQGGWLLGAFSTQDSGHYVPPPASTILTQRDITYGTWATASAQTSRTPMLMFTDSDGFLYAVDASGSSSGATLWGWTTRSILPKLQNYSTMATSGATDGGFTVADARNGSAWASYLVGSFQSGAEHFSVKLDATGKPSVMVYDTVVTGGSSAGDKAGATGVTPLRQPTVIAYIGNSAFNVYVVTVGTVSTLYETNVATGATSNTILTFTATSAITINPTTNQIYLGSKAGTVWMATLTTGTAATDVVTILNVGTTKDPVANTVLPVIYAGYAEIGGVPYIYAFNTAQLTVFGVTSTGFQPLWASTPTAGYTYSVSTGSYSVSATVTTLTTGSEITDIPIVVGNALLVPVFVPGQLCSNGTGYYDFFNIVTGAFPAGLPVTVNGVAVTSDINLGANSGPAYSPSVTATSTGLMLNSGSKATVDDSNKRLGLSHNITAKPFSWRQH